PPRTPLSPYTPLFRSPTLSTRFTHPRGPFSHPGLGLRADQVDDLTDFLENGLYDPAFVKDDPHSSTRTFQLNERDLTYSKYRPRSEEHTSELQSHLNL